MSAKGVEKSTKRGSALGNDRPIRGKALNIYIYGVATGTRPAGRDVIALSGSR